MSAAFIGARLGARALVRTESQRLGVVAVAIGTAGSYDGGWLNLSS